MEWLQNSINDQEKNMKAQETLFAGDTGVVTVVKAKSIKKKDFVRLQLENAVAEEIQDG